MAFFGLILRSRRGDFNLFLIAALVALLVLPGASHAAIAPQSAEAVLLWLQSEVASGEIAAPPLTALGSSGALLSLAHQSAEPAPQTRAVTQLSAATFHCGQWSAFPRLETKTEAQIAPVMPTLERHAVARLAGVRTNRRLI